MFWYEDDIKRLEKLRTELSIEPETLFYGSSSIRLWSTLVEDLNDLKPINLGFGGSSLAACTWFFDRVMDGYQPKRLVVYAGDNDLGDGRHPEEIFIFFQQFAANVMARFGALPCYFISLKPSVTRWGIINQFHYTNKIIAADITDNHPNWHWINVYDAMLNADGWPDRKYFVGDGLHLSEKGYQLWTNLIKNAITI
ncbi:GDSL-type esterase/lipase family protein [Mucilaginibacter antarcticus]|uniref:GDSL-type esterase/lipase family protein n=1 Tax=Mucilaginibacter antarcticus TaxID=1855725 RepID=A0ABW5XKI0_9SPHI